MAKGRRRFSYGEGPSASAVGIRRGLSKKKRSAGVDRRDGGVEFRRVVVALGLAARTHLGGHISYGILVMAY